MSSVETVRLSREEFVKWLAKALSGSLIQPASGHAGAARSTDVTLASLRGTTDSWPVVCVPQAQFRDLFAFVSTYTKTRPFSAFFRVLPLELISVLERGGESASQRSTLAKCVAGAAIAETWVASARQADQPKNVFSLLFSSLSATLGQVVLAGYDEAAFDWAFQEWVELRSAPDDILRRQDLIATSAPWRLLTRVAGMLARPISGESDPIARFVSTALGEGAIHPPMLPLLAPISGPVDLLTLLSASREERITRFNEFISFLKRRSERNGEVAFLAGLMLAIAGNGNFELLRSAREFDGWLDGAVVWFGFCAALFEEGNVLTYANSAGRRLMRELSQADNPFTPPRVDIASREFGFLTHNDALTQIVTHAPGAFDIEILPNVVTRVIGAAFSDDGRRRDEADMIVRNLEEASYLIERARRIAMGVDRHDSQGSLLKPQRRTKSR